VIAGPPEALVQVRGTVTDEELAAVLAALVQTGLPAVAPAYRYERWRRGRIAALGAHLDNG
jgi:hypothetical protein